MNNPEPDAHASWFALNAYGALIAYLEVIIGVTGVLNPARIVAVYGYMPPLAYVWLVGYTFAGAMLLFALHKRRVDVEVYSIVFLVAANVLQLAIALSALGASAVTRDFLISAVLAWMMTLRGKALLRGGTFVVPRWHRRRS